MRRAADALVWVVVIVAVTGAFYVMSGSPDDAIERTHWSAKPQAPLASALHQKAMPPVLDGRLRVGTP